MNSKTNHTYSVRGKYMATATILENESGILLDIGSRDGILQKTLKNPSLRYQSADVCAGHDYQIDLEKPLPFEDKAFDHVVALDVLEHVNSIHDAFAEVLRVARHNVIIALPNLASLHHRLHFLFHGRLGTDKYDLTPDARSDRHHWLTIYPQINRFVADCAPRYQFTLKTQIIEGETGVLKIPAAISHL